MPKREPETFVVTWKYRGELMPHPTEYTAFHVEGAIEAFHDDLVGQAGYPRDDLEIVAVTPLQNRDDYYD